MNLKELKQLMKEVGVLEKKMEHFETILAEEYRVKWDEKFLDASMWAWQAVLDLRFVRVILNEVKKRLEFEEMEKNTLKLDHFKG